MQTDSATRTLSTAILPPPIPGRPASAEYRIWVNSTEAYLPAICGFAGGTAAFFPFETDGPAEIRIWADRSFDSAAVHPTSYGIACEREGNEIRFTLPGPCNVFVKWDDGFELPLYIWAAPVQRAALRPDASGMRYFAPGVHHAGEIRLASNETLYLAPGAFVHGYIAAENAENVTVCGRGILCASQYATHNGPAHDMAGFRRCRNVRVEGVVLLDAWGWTLVFHNCDNVTVDGVKILCERTFSTDGINPCNCRDVAIRNCFVRCKDDCVSVKGLDGHYSEPPDAQTAWSPIRDILVEDCVFWSDNNNCLVVGTETRAEVVERVLFRNIDILKASNTCGDVAGALAVISLHDTQLRDIRFEDIRIEHATGPWLNIFFTDSIFGIPGMRCAWGGNIRDIALKNISITGGPLRPAYIRGYDAAHRVENVRIENLSVFGRPVQEPADARIMIGDYVDDVSIVL